MLVIDRIACSRRDGGAIGVLQDRPYVYLDNAFSRLYGLSVWLRNTETGRVDEYYAPNWTTFALDMIEYKPYGWFPSDEEYDDAMFVAVDKQSLDFFDLVESVEEIDARNTEEYSLVHGLHNQFTFWDSRRGIVDCSFGGVHHGFTLFAVMCFLQEGWCNDMFYMKYKTGGYRIKFNDPGKARTAIAKAVVMGYSPVAACASNLPHLVARGIYTAVDQGSKNAVR